jgi:hypothetical protein
MAKLLQIYVKKLYEGERLSHHYAYIKSTFHLSVCFRELAHRSNIRHRHHKCKYCAWHSFLNKHLFSQIYMK